MAVIQIRDDHIMPTKQRYSLTLLRLWDVAQLGLLGHLNWPRRHTNTYDMGHMQTLHPCIFSPRISIFMLRDGASAYGSSFVCVSVANIQRRSLKLTADVEAWSGGVSKLARLNQCQNVLVMLLSRECP